MSSNGLLTMGRLGSVLSLTLLFLVIYYLIHIGNNYVDENKKIILKKEKVIPILLTILALLIFVTIFKRYKIVSDTIYTILFSAILAYLFNPIIDFFERKGLKRTRGVLILYISIVALILILAFLVIPKSSREIKNLVQSMPSYVEEVTEIVDHIYNKYYLKLGELPPIFQGIQSAIMTNLEQIQSMAINGIKNFFTGIVALSSKIVSIVLTPILTFYFLVDKKKFKGSMVSLIPEKNREEAFILFREIDTSLSSFVRGRLIMAVYVGVCTTILLLILNIEFSVVIGIITAFADIVPYIGPFLGFLPAVFFAFLSSPMKALWVSIAFVLIQWTENNIIAPKVIGDSTGIHPMVILLSIIIGGGIFGVFGMILSVPFVAVCIILFKFFREKFKTGKVKEENL